MDEQNTTPSQSLGASVAQHVRRLGRKRPVRRVAEQLSAGDVVSEWAFDVLIAAVEQKSGRRWRERLVAAACLGEGSLTAAQKERATAALISVLTDRSNLDVKGRLARGVLRAVALSSIVAGVLVAISFDDALGFSPWNAPLFVASLLLGSLVAIGILSIFLVAPTLMYSGAREDTNLRKSMEEVLRALGKLADPMAVGLLSRAQQRTSPLVKLKSQQAAVAAKALPAALAAVREEHYGLLPADATPALCEALSGATRRQALLILSALRAAGIGSGAEPLRRMIADPAAQRDWESSPDPGDGRTSVLSVAEEVLPILEERLRNETASSRLLRPASTPGDAAEVLLRPAGSASAVPDEQLLRPAVVEQSARAEQVD